MNRREAGITLGVRLGFVALLLAIVATAALSYRSTARLAETSRRVTAGQDAVIALHDLLSSVQDAETGQRGYLLTGDRHYLAPYLAARRSLLPALQRLHETLQSREQRRRLAELRPVITAKLHELALTIRLMKRGDADGARGEVQAGIGKREMERIRALVAEMVTGERAELRRRTASVRQATVIAAVTFSLTAALSIGLVVLLYGVLRRRVAEREQTNRDLRERERRLNELADAMPQNVWTARPDGFLDYFNRRWCEYTGLSLEESVGAGWTPALHPDDLERVQTTWQQAVERGEPGVVETRFRRASDGAFRWHLIRVVPIKDGSGRVARWVGTSTDIDDQKRTEEALRISEERFRVSIANAPFVVYQCDRNLRYTWVANVPGDVAAEHLLGRRIDEVLATLDRRELADTTALHETVLRTGQGQRREVQWTRHGTTRHYDLTIEPLRNEQGAVMGLTGVAMEVTARKLVENTLRESRDVIETVNRVGQTVAAELDLEKVVQTVTDAATRLAGAKFGAFFYNQVGEPGDAYMLYALSGAPRAAFASFPLPRNTPVFAPTFRGDGVVRLDDVKTDPRYGQNEPFRGMPAGHLPVASYLAVPVVARAGGVLGGIFLGHPEPGVFTEHHERLVVGLAAQAAVAIDNARLYDAERRARATAEDAARRTAFLAEAGAAVSISLDYHSTLDAVANVVVPTIGDICVVDVLEPDGSLRRAGASRLDESKADVLREFLVRKELPPDPRHPLRQVFETGRSVLVGTVSDADLAATDPATPAHLDMIRRLGIHSYMLVPLVARGRSLGVIGVAATQPGRYGPVDLTLLEVLARRAALAVDNARLYAEAQEANRMKDEFLTTVSHELRTPLAAMMNWVGVLRQGKLSSERVAHALDVLQRAGEAQAKLIEDILDVSRAVTGRLRLEPRPVDLAHVVAEALEAVRPAAESKGVRLTREIDVGGGPLLGDPVRLQQVAWNLLANAVKFTPSGGRVTVRVERDASEARLIVSDTGDGIDPDFLPHVFERFRQADHVTTRHYGGLGLGLAIVKHLVEAHGGRVEARSEGRGKGAEFVVRLPLSPLGAAPPSRRRSAQAAAG